MAKDVHDSQGVNEYIQKLDPHFIGLVNNIRQLILDTDSIIGEQIKWNSPSFFYKGEMKPFNPKEYKRDIAVMNLRKGVVMLVFPTGATIKGNTGILEGKYTDGRRMVTFNDENDVHTKGKQLQIVIKQWLSQVE
ncbi:MAG: DUF1801 domain-containing protein [Saprospiraceae bacterium]|nr:DUF1801 domain-containing protein [Saprospiraceae bacterium]